MTRHGWGVRLNLEARAPGGESTDRRAGGRMAA